MVTLAPMGNLSDRIREAAEEIGGLKRLSELIGVPRRTLGNWLTGTQPKPGHLRRIADETGVTLQWLISGEGPKNFANGANAVRELGSLTENPNGMTHEEFETVAQEKFSAAMQELRRAESLGSGSAGSAGVDIVLLERLSDQVQAVFIECEQSAPPRAITAAAGNLYNELLHTIVDIHDQEIVEAVLPVLRARFKKHLKEVAASAGTGKLSAS